MLYYSEVLNKTFKTEEELKKQENSYLAKKSSDEKSKKELVREIEAKDEEIKKAREDFAKVKADSTEEIAKVQREQKKKIDDACNKLDNLECEKIALIRKFADKYGVYQKVYTGENAERELKSLREYYNSLFSDFWGFFR